MKPRTTSRVNAGPDGEVNNVGGVLGYRPGEANLPVKITGDLPPALDRVVREVLRRALERRPEEFVVNIGWRHGELVVQFQRPLDRRLKFSQPLEGEIARELYTVVNEIVDDACGPIRQA